MKRARGVGGAPGAAHRLSAGLYIGCGNGRNLVPLLAAGLDLTGLDIHLFSAAELTSLVPGSCTEVLPLRRHSTARHPPSRGQWSQWEVIWRCPLS